MKMIQQKVLTKHFSIILQLIFGTILFCQHVPIELDHPIYVFIRQEIAQGRLDIKYGSSMPLYRGTILDLLDELERKSSNQDKLIKRFRAEFSINKIHDGMEFPWEKQKLSSDFSSLTSFSIDVHEPHILTYKDSQNIFWADLEERITFEFSDEPHHIYRDRFAFSVFLDKTITVHTDFRMHRYAGALPIPEQITYYKDQWVEYYPEVNWSIWYEDQSLIHYKGKHLDFELSKTPFTWGYSPNYSSIFSANTAPFPFIGIEKSFNKVRFKSIHGFLLPFSNEKIHTMGSAPEKNIAAHRLEIDLTSNFTASVSEMAVYGGRRFDAEYLLPLNWFWGSEHNLGDRDNILMAVDYCWRIKPGILVYQTLLWDELDWAKLFKPWWGNKYVFQTGVYWVPFTNPKYPDFRVEWTASRPWVYTHYDSLITYTSADIGIGFPEGPNSQLLYVETNWWMSPQSLWRISYRHLVKGSGLGSNPTHNYNDRDNSLDENTPSLLGETTVSNKIELRGTYRLSLMLEGFANISYQDQTSQATGQIGFVYNW